MFVSETMKGHFKQIGFLGESIQETQTNKLNNLHNIFGIIIWKRLKNNQLKIEKSLSLAKPYGFIVSCLLKEYIFHYTFRGHSVLPRWWSSRCVNA